MDRGVLEEYIDACENIKDLERDIRELKKRRKTIIQTSVTGSNPNFPYEKTHFKITGAQFSYADDHQLRTLERILVDRKTKAEQLKLDVETWINTIPQRMQRIIRYRVFEGMTWEQVAMRMGRRATADSVKKEYQRFMGEGK